MTSLINQAKSIKQINDLDITKYKEEIPLIQDINTESEDEFDDLDYLENKDEDDKNIEQQKEEFNKRFSLDFGRWVTSTMTVISDLGTRVDLPLIYDNLNHTRCEGTKLCKGCSNNATEVKSIRFRDCNPKGIPPKKVNKRKNSKKKKVFYNQITIDIEINPGRKISTKLFIDGKIQMAGCKNEEDAHKTVTVLIKHLKKISEIEEPGTVSLSLFEEEYEKMLKMKETMNKTKWRNIVYSKKSEHIKGSIKSKMNVYEIPIIRKAVEDKSKMKPQYFKIAMINSDFKVNLIDNEDNSVNPVTIDRNTLRDLLCNKYGLFCPPYESSRYPGVNAKKISSIDCIHGCSEGKGNPSMCAFNMKKKKVTNGCVTVSILAFQQGKIILTGAQSTRQLDDTYDFITKVYKDNFFELRNKLKNKLEQEYVSDIDLDSD